MLKAKDIMNTRVVTVDGMATVAEAVTLMREKGVRALIVERRTNHEDADSVLSAWGWDSDCGAANGDDAYGIITESDIVYKVAAYGKDTHSLCVHEVMTKPCIVVNPDLGVEYVARLFANSHLHQAPVIRDKLEGIISVVDIMAQAI